MRNSLVVAAIGALLLSTCLFVGIKKNQTQKQVSKTEDSTDRIHTYWGKYQYGGCSKEGPIWHFAGNFVLGTKPDTQVSMLEASSTDSGKTLTGTFRYEGYQTRKFKAVHVSGSDSDYKVFVDEEPSSHKLVLDGIWVFPSGIDNSITGIELNSPDSGRSLRGKVRYGDFDYWPLVIVSN